MKVFAQSLLSEVKSHLKTIHAQTEEPTLYAEQAIKMLSTIIEKLKTKCINHVFANKAEEIDFFRNSKPQVAAMLIYYNDIYNIETHKPFGTTKALRKYYKTEVAKLETYFTENRAFYKYYRTGNRSLDKKYFLRGKHDFQHTLDSFYFHADHRFTTSHDYKVAKILANDKIKSFLETEISKLENKQQTQGAAIRLHKTQKWTGSKVALIELIYALHTEGVFNNGTAELKEVASFFEAVFEVDLGQFNRTFLEIRSRKSERTKFLNTLKEKLKQRMDAADEK